jgi:AraC-like DNA-binding protein
MNNSIINQGYSSDIARIFERENSGIRSVSLSRIALGFVVSGTKYIYNNDQFHQINEGDIFVLGTGLHYEENIVNTNGLFEQIVFYFSANTLQQAIFSLNINYGLSFSSRHSCNQCMVNNFAISKAENSVHNFFVGLDISFRRAGLLHNDIGQLIKLNELIYLILSGEDNCIKRKLLRSADTTSGLFINTIYENIFNDISIEKLAEITNRSLTSFKKEFKRIFDKSPHQWIITQRLDRAKILLSSTSRTVSEIGAECGFTNISHFIKLFKQRYLRTPASYRRQHNVILHDEHRTAVGE